MASIQPETFRKLTETWQNMLNKGEGEKLKQILAIDGKTIRGNGNKNQDPLHMVSVWSKGKGVCFGQKSADGKGKEIPMIKALLGCCVGERGNRHNRRNGHTDTDSEEDTRWRGRLCFGGQREPKDLVSGGKRIF
jgi:hypothetical protein